MHIIIVIRVVSSNVVTWMMNSYFVIVSSNDTPVYEADFFKPEAAVRVKTYAIVIGFLNYYFVGRSTEKFSTIHFTLSLGYDR